MHRLAGTHPTVPVSYLYGKWITRGCCSVVWNVTVYTLCTVNTMVFLRTSEHKCLKDWRYKLMCNFLYYYLIKNISQQVFYISLTQVLYKEKVDTYQCINGLLFMLIIVTVLTSPKGSKNCNWNHLFNLLFVLDIFK